MQRRGLIFANLLLVVGIFGCSDSSTAPGAGPPFSSVSPTLTAADLWLNFSFRPFHVRSSSGDHACADIIDPNGTGMVHIDISEAGNRETNSFTYTDCSVSGPLYSSGQNLELEVNGDIQREYVWTDKESQSYESYSFEQHVSLSGDLGFAADCDYSSTAVGFSGSCTYRDSDGQELSITASEMTEALQDAIADGLGPS